MPTDIDKEYLFRPRFPDQSFGQRVEMLRKDAIAGGFLNPNATRDDVLKFALESSSRAFKKKTGRIPYVFNLFADDPVRQNILRHSPAEVAREMYRISSLLKSLAEEVGSKTKAARMMVASPHTRLFSTDKATIEKNVAWLEDLNYSDWEARLPPPTEWKPKNPKKAFEELERRERLRSRGYTVRRRGSKCPSMVSNTPSGRVKATFYSPSRTVAELNRVMKLRQDAWRSRTAK